MNGSDHQRPQARLPALLAAANRRQDHFEFDQLSLAEYLAGAPERPTCRTGQASCAAGPGPTCSWASFPIGSTSRSAAAAAERELERVAEPLAALWLPPELWPGRLLDEAWLAVIRNSAHDSVCGCSADAVGRAVLHRYDVATTLAHEVIDRALALAEVATDTAGLSGREPGPGASERDGRGGPGRNRSDSRTLRCSARIPAGRRGAHRYRRRPGPHPRRAEHRRLARQREGRRRRDRTPAPERPRRSVITADASARPEPGLASVLAEAWAQAGRPAPRSPPGPGRTPPGPTGRGPGDGGARFGWAPFRPAPLGQTAVAGGTRWLENGLVRVEVDSEDGTFSLNGLAGLDRLVDGGDEGDTYNYSPPRVDTIVEQPELVDGRAHRDGPGPGPPCGFDAASPGRQTSATGIGSGSIPWRSSLTCSCTRAKTFVRVDDSLRQSLPRPPAPGLVPAAAARPTTPSPNAPSRPCRGAPPREVRTSRPWAPTRRVDSSGGRADPHPRGSAGTRARRRRHGPGTDPPPLHRRAVPPGANRPPQLRPGHPTRSRPRSCSAPNEPATPWRSGAVDPWRLADAAWLPLLVRPASGTGTLGASGSRLTVRGAEVSALRRSGDGAIEVRVFNPADEPATVEIRGHTGWLVDLRGRRLEPWAERFELRPWGDRHRPAGRRHPRRLDHPSDAGTLGPGQAAPLSHHRGPGLAIEPPAGDAQGRPPHGRGRLDGHAQSGQFTTGGFQGLLG